MVSHISTAVSGVTSRVKSVVRFADPIENTFCYNGASSDRRITESLLRRHNEPDDGQNRSALYSDDLNMMSEDNSTSAVTYPSTSKRRMLPYKPTNYKYKRRRNSHSLASHRADSCEPIVTSLSKAMYAFLLLHLQLAHVSYTLLYEAIKDGTLTGFPYSWRSIDVNNLPPCSVDRECKSTILPKQHTERIRANAPRQLFHSDLKGPMKVRGIHGEKYWMTFVDDYSGMIFVYFLKRKSESVEALQQFLTDHIRPYGTTNFTLVHDRGGEYTSDQFTKMCATEGIRLFPTPPKNKRYNGVAERANRTLAEKERCLRRYAHLPRRTWTLSAQHAADIHNITPSARHGYTSPYYRWCCEHPSTTALHVYGSECYLHNSDYSSLVTTHLKW